MQKLLGEVVDQLSDTIFNFSKITLTFFDDNKILLLQRTIYKKVMVIVNSDSSSLVSGITNTILRDHFFLIHELFAKKILEASNISRGVFKFFEQHFVEEENGTRWSSFAITRFMNEYSKEVDEYKRFEDEYYTNLKRLEGYRGVEDELEEDFHKHNEHMNEKRKIERLVSLFKLKMGEQEEKISEIKGKYEALVDGTAKTLLQKRLVVKK
jgi:DNA integrity scanning protein DisA with diadenylate cyclase activity